jgi:hypothetical protein
LVLDEHNIVSVLLLLLSVWVRRMLADPWMWILHLRERQFTAHARASRAAHCELVVGRAVLSRAAVENSILISVDPSCVTDSFDSPYRMGTFAAPRGVDSCPSQA